MSTNRIFTTKKTLVVLRFSRCRTNLLGRTTKYGKLGISEASPIYVRITDNKDRLFICQEIFVKKNGKICSKLVKHSINMNQFLTKTFCAEQISRKFSACSILNNTWLSVGCVLQARSERDKLSCYYNRNLPTQLLKPVKVEMLNWDPDLYLFHDVITDSEIEHVKKLAKPQVCGPINITIIWFKFAFS